MGSNKRRMAFANPPFMLCAFGKLARSIGICYKDGGQVNQ
jgi:hypothetical protein